MEEKQLEVQEDVLMDSTKFFCINEPFSKLEYIRTKGQVIKDYNGKLVENKDGKYKRARGQKKGVFLAFVEPEDPTMISIGFSLCHKMDRFNYREGKRMEGLGQWYAFQKAKKYRDKTVFVICTNPEDRQISKDIVKIPQSIFSDLQTFIIRCRSYYKDRIFPIWATRVLNSDPLLDPKCDCSS